MTWCLLKQWTRLYGVAHS